MRTAILVAIFAANAAHAYGPVDLAKAVAEALENHPRGDDPIEAIIAQLDDPPAMRELTGLTGDKYVPPTSAENGLIYLWPWDSFIQEAAAGGYLVERPR